MIRQRLRNAWSALRGRPLEIAFDWGEGHEPPVGADRKGLHIVALTVPTVREDLMLSIGWGGWLWDGAEFPWATVGPCVLTFGDDDMMTTVRLEIPVRMAGASPVEE